MKDIMPLFLRGLILLSFLILSIQNSVYASTETNSVVLSLTTRTSTDTLWSLWDSFDSRTWAIENWGGSGSVDLAWGHFHGRDCMKVTVSSNFGVIRTENFLDENWNPPVTGLRMDVFCGTNPAGNGLKLAAYNHSITSIQETYSSTNLVYNNWKTMGWDFSGGYSQVARILFIFDWLGTTYKPYTFYINNIRLVSNNQLVPWDSMAVAAHAWSYKAASDAVLWNSGTLIPISHNQTSASNPAGALYMQWDASQDPAHDYAQIEAPVNEDWSLYANNGKIRAMVNCSGTNMIYLGFWDNNSSTWVPTSEKRVVNTNTWEEITWDLPPTFPWGSLTSMSIYVKTDKVLTGHIFVDNLMRGW